MPFQKNNKLHLLRKEVIISPKQRKQISETLKRKYRSGEIKSHLYKGMPKEEHPNFNKKLSQKTKDKISIASKGKKKSEAHKQKLSQVKKDLFARGILKSPSFKLIGKKLSLEERIKHSLSCKGINKGKLNGAYKGGHWKSRANIPIYKMNTFKKKVLARDNYKCLMCFSRKKLEVHHIIQVAENPKKALIVSNGITLCKKCHYFTHYPKQRTTEKLIPHTLNSFMEKIECLKTRHI